MESSSYLYKKYILFIHLNNSFCFSTVTFRNCDEGNVQLKAADTSAFTVSQEGVVYTLQPLSLGMEEKAQVMIYAQDLQSNRIWHTRVHLEINTAPEQVPQQHTLPKGFM